MNNFESVSPAISLKLGGYEMTIQGAVHELNQMLSSTVIPDYIKPTIKKIIETIVDEFSDQQSESEE